MKVLKRVIAFLKKHRIWAILVLAAVLLTAFLLRPKGPPPIPTQQVKKGDIEQTVTATGTVAAKTSVNLVFQVPGLVTYVSAKKGDYVEAYQTIASIDQRSVQKNLENALIDYSKQRNAFEQVKDDNHAETPTEAVNDKIKRILENNQFDLNKAVNSVELQALVRQESFLTTPIAGIVSRADIETAGVVAGPTATYTVVDPMSVVFNMDVDEADVAKLRTGQIANVTLDAYPEQVLNLAVASIDFVSHNTSTGGTAYTVEATLPSNENYAYRVGMGGDSEILIRKQTDVVVVPLAAVFNDNHVYLKTTKGYEDRKISLGLQNDTDAEVLAGLRPGDMIVLQPDLVTKQNQKNKVF